MPINPILYGLQKLHILYGGGFTPTKLKCLYAHPKGAQLYAIGFLWCINSIILWINNFFGFHPFSAIYMSRGPWNFGQFWVKMDKIALKLH